MTPQQQSAHGKDGVPTLPSKRATYKLHTLPLYTYVCASVEQSWWDRTLGTRDAQHCFAGNSFSSAFLVAQIGCWSTIAPRVQHVITSLFGDSEQRSKTPHPTNLSHKEDSLAGISRVILQSDDTSLVTFNL